MFIAKKILGLSLMPLSVVIALLLVALLLHLAGRQRRLAIAFTAAATLILVAVAFRPLADLMAPSLEAGYQPQLSAEKISGVEWVVVLGSGHNDDERLPATAQLQSDALACLIEGIRLHHMIPASRLLVSGGSPYGGRPEALVYAEAARSLGVADSALVAESRPRDTAEEARYIVERIGNQPFLLVTSASHMRRSMELFQAQGGSPLASPAGLYRRDPHTTLADYFPKARHVHTMEAAWHELLGRLWNRLKGLLG